MAVKFICNDCGGIINGWVYSISGESTCDECVSRYREEEIARLVKKFKRRGK